MHEEPLPAWQTHRVFNQPPPLCPYDPLSRDNALRASLAQAGADWARAQLGAYSHRVGGDLQGAAELANQQSPRLHTHDAQGRRIDQVEFHPAYHQLMQAACENGWPTLPWRQPRAGAHSARAALQYLHHQADSGSGCPLTMTFAGVPVLRHLPDLAAHWERRLCARAYDPRDCPWFDKQALTLGMGMTEKQGGTDVRANTTWARASGNGELGPEYEICGHKWFLSAPMSDGFLVLAQTDAGPTCFLLPRWRPDGTRNSLCLQRLKSKLGNRSNASSEVEFQQAFAWRLGDEGRGVRTILEMVALTRFDCMVGSAALMRQALTRALHHCRHRQVGGLALEQQPLMRAVLADLAVDSEAALHLAMRVARALDRGADDHQEQLFLRLATALGKYWICKRAPGFVYEAMECLGGNGYVEDSVLPRLYREAPVNAIWEGSGNVQCLDVLRAVQRQPETLQACIAEIELARGCDPRFDDFWQTARKQLPALSDNPAGARLLAEVLARALQASLLLRHGFEASAEHCCASLAPGPQTLLYGSSLPGDAATHIIEYAWPPT